MNKMPKRLLAVAALHLWLLCAAALAQTAATPTPEAALIKAEAEKSSRAFVSGDYGKVLDSTYSQLVVMGGGKAKMLASMEMEMKEMRDLGLKIISHTVGEPQPTVRAGTKLLAVVPTTLKIEAPDSFITQQSFWLAVSSDGGKSWTFIDGSFLNKESLKMILPEAADKITLPGGVKPVMERKAAG